MRLSRRRRRREREKGSSVVSESLSAFPTATKINKIRWAIRPGPVFLTGHAQWAETFFFCLFALPPRLKIRLKKLSYKL